MTLNIEGFLKDLNLGEEDVDHLWEYFYGQVLNKDDVSFEAINKKLAEYDLFEEMYHLYERNLKKKASLPETREYFESYWNAWFSRNKKCRYCIKDI